MKHLLTILSGLLVALLFARCADDDNLSGGIDGLPERGIVIRLSTGELDTRTQLTSTGDYHHVEEVWAVLYKLEGTDANDLNNYKLKGTPTKLGSMEDGQFVAWNPYGAKGEKPVHPGENASDKDMEQYEEDLKKFNDTYGGEYGNGKIQGREFVLPESGAMEAGTYRVLCIGFDKESKKVYDLMSGETLNNTIFATGKTLAEAKAKMTIETKAYEEQTGTYQMYGYDGTGELFAGWTEFEFEPDNINIAEVELKRRVAGILCYVTDIPAMIENTKVKGIRLCLNTKANDEIGLCRLDKPWEDFGAGGGGDASSYGGTTLAYRDLSDWKTDGEILTNDEGKNLTMGVYLIPINVVNDTELGSNFNTLSVQLFGGENYQFNKETGKVTGGEPIKTFNVLNEQGHSTDRGETAERYNILPNYIYHIGDKDDDTDEPMSLLGQKITVKPKVWTGETIPVEFPSVPIKVSMDLINEYDDVYDADRYVFDCIGIDDVEGYGSVANPPSGYDSYPLYYPNTQRLYLKVSPSVLHSHWEITISRCDKDGKIIPTPDGEDGMLYISKSSGYEQEYKASTTEDNEGAKIPLLLTDYAISKPDEKRYAKITLSSDGNTEEMIVQQYSAIIVNYDDRVLGFSHYDWGTVRDTRTGEVETDGETAMWNYEYRANQGVGITAIDIFGYEAGSTWYNGAKNIAYAKNQLGDGAFLYNHFYYGTSEDGCAMYKAAKHRISVSGNSKDLYSEGNPSWFLPAYYEMNQFMIDYKNQKDTYHIRNNGRYWTSSTSRANSGFTSHTLYYDGGDIEYANEDRDLSYYMRQAVLIVGDVD